jgi:hypothetical protein
MATPPDFSVGQVLTAANMNAVGLWLVKTQAVGTGVSSVVVDDAFSAEYENYKVIYSGGVGSGLHNMGLQLGSANTSYFGFGVYGTFAGSTVLGIPDNNAARFNYIGGGDTSGSTVIAEIRSPFAAKATYISAPIDTGTSFGQYSGRYFPTTSFTDFTIAPDGGATLTGGTIRVYGYRN